MLISRRHPPSIGRKIVHYSVAITAAIISVFLIYSHSSIDAFSLGSRTLPTAQPFDHQDSKDPNSYAVIHIRNPLRPFSRLQTKGGNDDDDTISKNDIDVYGSTGYDGNSDSSGSDSSSPFFAESDGPFQMTNGVSPVLEQQSQQQQVDDNESKEDTKTVEKNSIDSSSPFFAKKEDQFQMTNRVSPLLEQQPQQPPADDNKLDKEIKSAETQTTPEKSPGYRSSLTPVQRIPIIDQFTSNVEEEKVNYNSFKGQFISNVEEENANYNSGRPTSLLKRAKNEEFNELIDSPQAMGEESREIFDQSVKTVLEAIVMVKGLPSKVSETAEKTQQILKDVQDIPNKVNESVQNTKQSVEETVEKTQQTIKDVQDSIQDTKQSVEETVEKTQQTIKDVQDIPKKVTRSLEDTKQSISEKQEPVRKAVSSAKVFLGLERPSLRSRWYRTIPMTPKEEALDLAGKATLATGKIALWAGKGVGSLAWKGTRSVYNNTIGPAVEVAWNEQLDSLNDSVERAATFVKKTPSRVISVVPRINQRGPASASSSASSKDRPTNIERGPASVDSASAKIQPTRIQRSPASISGSANAKNQPTARIQRNPASGSGSASAKNQRTSIQQQNPTSVSSSAKKQPAFVSRKKLKADRKSQHKKENKGKSERQSAKPVVKIAVKSPEELNKEIEDALKLANEISNALDVAERAMKIKPDSELDDPMIEIDKVKSIGRMKRVVPPPPPPPPSIIEETTALVEKRNKRQTEVNDVLARFKPKPEKTLAAQLKEAQSLAKEIADALEMAEQSLMTASADSTNSNEENEVEVQLEGGQSSESLEKEILCSGSDRTSFEDCFCGE
jgi:hypothetical protein